MLCPLCGCDAVNGYVPGEPCPDCDPCACGHSGFVHDSQPPWKCDADGCPCVAFRPAGSVAS